MALTGFLHQGTCFATYDEAMSAKFGADPILEIAATNGTDKIHFYEFLNGQWVWSEYATSGAAWTLQYHSPVAPVGFVRCDSSFSVFLPPAPADILYVFSWGFGAVLFFFFMGFVIGMASKAINKV